MFDFKKVIVTDIIWGLAALGLAVLCVYREEQLNKELSSYKSVVNVGSFGEAAVNINLDSFFK